MLLHQLPLLLLLLLLPSGLQGQQCQTSRDCDSPYAPHCSKWGWCQWTAGYGNKGPDQKIKGESQESCRSSADCSPRTPVCSQFGFCSAGSRLPGWEGGQRSDGNHRVTQRQRNWAEETETSKREEKQRQSTGFQLDSGGVLPSNTFLLNRPKEWDGVKDEKEQQQSHGENEREFGRKLKDTNRNYQKKADVVDQRTFLLMPTRDSESTVRNFKSDNQRPKERKPFTAFHHQTSPNQFASETLLDITRESPLKNSPPTKKQESRQLLLPVGLGDPTVVPPTERFDRQSPDYHDYYDYSYYMDFEVLKMVANAETEAPTTTSRAAEIQEEKAKTLPPIMGLPVKEHPAQGESQGCLYDCVYDCVSIIQLTAYRDCVDFCGKTCKDK